MKSTSYLKGEMPELEGKAQEAIGSEETDAIVSPIMWHHYKPGRGRWSGAADINDRRHSVTQPSPRFTHRKRVELLLQEPIIFTIMCYDAFLEVLALFAAAFAAVIYWLVPQLRQRRKKIKIMYDCSRRRLAPSPGARLLSPLPLRKNLRWSEDTVTKLRSFEDSQEQLSSVDNEHKGGEIVEPPVERRQLEMEVDFSEMEDEEDWERDEDEEAENSELLYLLRERTKHISSFFAPIESLVHISLGGGVFVASRAYRICDSLFRLFIKPFMYLLLVLGDAFTLLLRRATA
jgi:hypothetical protein